MGRWGRWGSACRLVEKDSLGVRHGNGTGAALDGTRQDIFLQKDPKGRVAQTNPTATIPMCEKPDSQAA